MALYSYKYSKAPTHTTLHLLHFLSIREYECYDVQSSFHLSPRRYAGRCTTWYPCAQSSRAFRQCRTCCRLIRATRRGTLRFLVGGPPTRPPSAQSPRSPCIPARAFCRSISVLRSYLLISRTPTVPAFRPLFLLARVISRPFARDTNCEPRTINLAASLI